MLKDLPGAGKVHGRGGEESGFPELLPEPCAHPLAKSRKQGKTSERVGVPKRVGAILRE